MRLYISGPMTSKPECNFPAFHGAAARLRAQGHDVVNPAESFEGRRDLRRSIYMREDIASLLTVQAVAVLPGWMQSKGAKLEVAIARELGLPILYAADLEPVVMR